MTDRKAIELVGSMRKDRTGGGRARRANPQGFARGRARDAVSESGKVQTYRAKVKVFFKYEGKDRDDTRPPPRPARSTQALIGGPPAALR